MLMSQPLKNRKIFARCVATSLFLHICAVSLLHYSALWSPPAPVSTHPEDASWMSLVEKAERNQVLKEVFEAKQGDAAHSQHAASPQVEVPQFNPTHPAIACDNGVDALSYALF